MASSGNFCTLTPLVTNSGRSTMNGGTFSVGNLKYAMSGEDGFRSNYAITHKSYCEVYINSIGSYGGTIGFGSYQNEVTYEDKGDGNGMVEINRKVLADLAMNHPETFRDIVSEIGKNS